MTTPLLYDCDNTLGLPWKEIDDGLTLLYLLGRPDIQLLGVTTTFGNGNIGEVQKQTEQLLRDQGRGDIPVVEGAGARGQGPTAAARFMTDTAAAAPGTVTLLATGPLGNLRAAAQLDPGFFRNLRQIICMGGYLYPLRLGWRDLPELNLSADPEAAYSVLHAHCPVTLMNAQVCLQATFGWRDVRQAGFWNRDMRRMVRRWLLGFGLHVGVPVFYLWDLVPAVYVSHPELFEENPVKVHSTATDLETGKLVLTGNGAGAWVNMPKHILDAERFKALLFEAWQRQALGLVGADG